VTLVDTALFRIGIKIDPDLVGKRYDDKDIKETSDVSRAPLLLTVSDIKNSTKHDEVGLKLEVLLDTNVIMDALQERQPFDASAKEILRRGQSREIDILFTANAATDIFYLYRKARGITSARSAITFLLNTYGVVDITQDDCINALKIPMEDFEDALVAVCAKKAGVDFIVTRDEKFQDGTSPIPAISPDTLLSLPR
jgi:predicted nucleic acid-binding protein